MKNIICIIFVLGLSCLCWSRRDGAPPTDEVCRTLSPGHGVLPSTDESPYEILANHTAVNYVAIDIKHSDTPFRGFIIQARDADNQNIIVNGNFELDEINESKTFACGHENVNNTLTHTDNNEKFELLFAWAPPQEGYKGKVVFVATVVQDYSTFWTNLTSEKVGPFEAWEDEDYEHHGHHGGNGGSGDSTLRSTICILIMSLTISIFL